MPYTLKEMLGQSLRVRVEGVSHCSVHCRLAKKTWIDVPGEIRRRDWPGNAFLFCDHQQFSAYVIILSQSQRQTSSGTSNDGFSPDDSVKKLQ